MAAPFHLPGRKGNGGAPLPRHYPGCRAATREGREPLRLRKANERRGISEEPPWSTVPPLFSGPPISISRRKAITSPVGFWGWPARHPFPRSHRATQPAISPRMVWEPFPCPSRLRVPERRRSFHPWHCAASSWSQRDFGTRSRPCPLLPPLFHLWTNRPLHPDWSAFQTNAPDAAVRLWTSASNI